MDNSQLCALLYDHSSPTHVLLKIVTRNEHYTLWEGFWGIVIFGVEIENIGNELEIDSDLQVGY